MMRVLLSPERAGERTPDAQQLALVFPLDPGPRCRRHLSLEERFHLFDADHPEVYRLLRDLALQARNRGMERYSIKALWEVARWLYSLETGDEAFKLDNSFTALFARLLMDREPALAGFFETRERRAG